MEVDYFAVPSDSQRCGGARAECAPQLCHGLGHDGYGAERGVYSGVHGAPGLCFSCLQFTPEICFTAKKSVSFQCTARPMKLDVLFDVVGLSMDEV